MQQIYIRLAFKPPQLYTGRRRKITPILKRTPKANALLFMISPELKAPQAFISKKCKDCNFNDFFSREERESQRPPR